MQNSSPILTEWLRPRSGRQLFYRKRGSASYIDRFQVSHFRPVVIEIEIGGRSEKSLGGQESAAVNQECMGSNASSCSFALSDSLFDCLFLPEPVSCRVQRIARSNGKRNRSFTKNITTFAAGVEVLILIAMFFFLFFFLSIAIRSICVHHTVPGYIDQNVFGLQSKAKKNGFHFMKNCNASTHQPAQKKICLTPIMCIDVYRHALPFYFFSLYF